MNSIHTANLENPSSLTLVSQIPSWTFQCQKGGPYRIFLASTLVLRQRAKALVSRVYKAHGYNDINEEHRHILSTEASTPEITFLVQDEAGEDAGTISMNLDNRNRMPCEEIFSAEVAALRMQGYRMAEVTGLAISPRHTRSKALLVHLFNFISVAARRGFQGNAFVIEVNPKHENFYRKTLSFEEAGPVRSCRRVSDAPARLLCLDLEVQRELIRVEARAGLGAKAQRSRSLYAHFYPLEAEDSMVRFLKRSTQSNRICTMDRRMEQKNVLN